MSLLFYISIDKYLLANTIDDSDSDEIHSNFQSLLDLQNSSQNSFQFLYEINNVKNIISTIVSKVYNLNDLGKLESLLQQSLVDVTGNQF